MEMKFDGKPLAEIAPQAIDHFKSAETLRSLGIIAIAQGVAAMYEAKIKSMEEKVARAEALIEENETLRSKLSRPRNGRPSKTVGSKRRVTPEDADDVTKELMDEAYNGKKYRSKSEMRRLKIQRGEDGD